jgi:ATP-dependent 26S proteasome regulatory subunit
MNSAYLAFGVYFGNHCRMTFVKTENLVVKDIVIYLNSGSLLQEERSKVDDLRGTPMSVGTLEEIIDDNHAIVSTSVGSEHYVSILSFVDKDQLEPGCSVLLNHKVKHVVCCF